MVAQNVPFAIIMKQYNTFSLTVTFAISVWQIIILLYRSKHLIALIDIILCSNGKVTKMLPLSAKS